VSLAVGVAYLVVLGGLAVFGAHRLHLLWVLWRHPAPPVDETPPAVWPLVLVQLPLFNEAAVAERLLDAVAALDYPRDRLEVQVLDDSTDETVAVVAAAVARHHARGLAIEHVRRPTREGYKAGALAYGLERSAALLVAIFDADFVPAPDFLRRMVPAFRDPGLGLVQARWGHLNRERSLLTRLQALALDAHFRVEQAARSRSGRFFNFNGTAGVWRRQAIEAAGGWSAATITEDLDLSFRAQLCGWRFRFFDHVVVPAELPEELAAFRAQQQRWTRGSAQTLRKLLRFIWTTPEVAWKARCEATFQLLLNAAYPLMFLLALLTVPLAVWGYPADRALVATQWVLFAFATLAVAAFYLASQPGRRARALLEVPPLFACGLGLSLANGYAWLAGLLGGPAAFVRTPKRGAGARRYLPDAACAVVWGERLMTLYLAWGLACAATAGRWTALPFAALVCVGFAGMGWPRRRLRAAPNDPKSAMAARAGDALRGDKSRHLSGLNQNP